MKKPSSQDNALTDAALLLDAIGRGRVEPTDEAAARRLLDILTNDFLGGCVSVPAAKLKSPRADGIIARLFKG